MPDEEIKDCVNGFYEAGFALLVASNIRVLLVDKKPLNYLTVEDLRFDMINEIDYSHRLIGAQISISTGSKNLKFTSLNQQRLRSLIGHVQHCMAEAKMKQSEHQEDQKLHLEQINQQLQTYLLAQHREQQKMRQQLQRSQSGQVPAGGPAVKPSRELADYLYAQGLLSEYQAQGGHLPAQAAGGPPSRPGLEDLYAEGVREVFGNQAAQPAQPAQPPAAEAPAPADSPTLQTIAANAVHHALEVNPLRVAYSKLPMAMRNRRFGRPSFHAHSQTETLPPSPQASPAAEY
ncbi:MAG TPA: PH domain-containing protein [Candidatus Saccharimonadales bacterium]|nr:PH domain-containing protein [Candidatus Saccharimonadales bacterium]